MRPRARHHHVVDRGRQAPEEPFEGSIIGGVESRDAQRVELAGGALQRLAIPAGENYLGSLKARSPGGFESDAGAAADHHDGLREQFRFALHRGDAGCCGHVSSDGRKFPCCFATG